VWVVLIRQWALVEEANRRLSQQSAETAELRVAHTTVREEAVQAREAEAKVCEDTTKAREEAAKAHKDLTPLLACVKELEEDIALVGGQRDALNIQVVMASAHVRTLEDEVVTLKGTVRERDEALSGAGREIEGLRATVHDRDEALRAFEKTCGELRDEVMGWQTHSEGKLFVMLWPWRRGPRFMLTWCLCSRVGEGAASGSGDGHLIPKPLRGRGQADSVAPGCHHLRM
jgi:chromosome segregation ATPase